ncbi:hypothetical protein GCM10027048_30940 [Hymenobacter coalescens]
MRLRPGLLLLIVVALGAHGFGYVNLHVSYKYEVDGLQPAPNESAEIRQRRAELDPHLHALKVRVALLLSVGLLLGTTYRVRLTPAAA